MFDALKVLIIAPIESKTILLKLPCIKVLIIVLIKSRNNIVEATFS